MFDDRANPKWLGLWWLLWGACVFFLSIMLPYMDGTRAYLPYGQYIFFIFSIAVAFVIIFLDRLYIARIFSRSFLNILVVACAPIAFSALIGISPEYGLRLLGILVITTIPFAFVGSLVVIRPVMLVLPIFSVALVCAIGVILLQNFGPINIGNLKLANHLHMNRWSFLFNEANALGAMMAIGLSTSLYLIFVARRNWIKVVLGIIIIPLMLFVFWKTNSRASLLWVVWSTILAIIATLYLIYLRYNLSKRFWIYIAVIAIILLGLIYTMYHQDVVHFLRISQKDVTTGRVAIWKLYFKEMEQHPWWGFGFGATSEFLKGRYPLSPLNVYIGLIGEAGLLGALPFFLLWFGAIILAIRIAVSNLDDNIERSALALFALMILGGYALQQNGEWTIMRVSPDHYLFFFTVAMVFSLHNTMISSGAKSKEPALSDAGVG